MNANPQSPTDLEDQADELLLPAFILGALNIGGPIDDQDRKRAERMLEVTATRETLAAFLRTTKVRADLKMLLNIPEGRRILDERARNDITSHLDELSAPSTAEDVSDELWKYIQTVRRPYAEKILTGILPEK